MRKFLLLVTYAFILLLIGRNLPFLPVIPWNITSSAISHSEQMKQNVMNLIKNQHASYSVYYKNLKTGEVFGIDENKVLTGASLNKLVIAAHLYSLAAKSQINLEDQVVLQKEDVQDYGTGSLRYQEPGSAYSLQRLAQLMLEQSDNTAAYLLAVRIGKENTQEYVKSLGLRATQMDNNTTTSAEMGKLLELIYKKRITNDIYTKELLDFMKDTDFEDRLPRYLKGKAVVYHKTGDAVGMIHDVGIITDPKHAFIVAVLTSDSDNDEKTKDTIGKIAKMIYDEQK